MFMFCLLVYWTCVIKWLLQVLMLMFELLCRAHGKRLLNSIHIVWATVVVYVVWSHLCIYTVIVVLLVIDITENSIPAPVIHTLSEKALYSCFTCTSGGAGILFPFSFSSFPRVKSLVSWHFSFQCCPCKLVVIRLMLV